MTSREHNGGKIERRAHPRVAVLWNGSLSQEAQFDRSTLTCTIRNFSISGVHVLVDRRLQTDSPVILRIDRVGTFSGRVVWSDGSRLGIRFDEAPEQIAELTRNLI